MKITVELISIPPFISTSWSEIAAITKPSINTVTFMLKNGTSIDVSDLEEHTINEIFTCHQEFLLNKAENNTKKVPFDLEQVTSLGLSDLPFLGGSFTHSTALSDSPNIPESLLSRIRSLSSQTNFSDITLASMPTAVDACNCPYCQIVNAMRPVAESIDSDKVVSDEDLTFSQWEITPQENNLYTVTNIENKEEQYSVFLGTPIGCTCGTNNCSHIKAVLES